MDVFECCMFECLAALQLLCLGIRIIHTAVQLYLLCTQNTVQADMHDGNVRCSPFGEAPQTEICMLY
jgi:hypothetical protein